MMRRYPILIAAAFVAAATLVLALRHDAPPAHLAADAPALTATPRAATATDTRTPTVPAPTPTVSATAIPTLTPPVLPHRARRTVPRPTPTKAPRRATLPTATPRATSSSVTATGVSQAPPTATASATTLVQASTPSPAPAPPQSGQTSGPYTPGVTIDVPRLGVQAAVYDRGIDANRQLPIAPGYAVTHYKFSDALGARGNYVIYGHDDIQGSIFRYLPTMQVGDDIDLSAGGRRYTYRVTGSLVVSPDDVAVLNPTPDATITLISCTPYWVDTQRIVVKGALTP